MNRHNRTDAYVLIVKTENDVIVENVNEESFNIPRFMREKQLVPESIEMITKREFNRRLDEVLLVY